MRSLSAEEAELWARVAATIRPLSRETDLTAPQTEANPHPRPPRMTPRGQVEQWPGTSSRLIPLAAKTLDSGWDRRLRSGSVEPDRVLDLHGCNLDQAWRAIDKALERAISAGERVMLLITGHARPGDHAVGRGKIRAAVFDWLAASPHARRIAAVRPAHGRHGGAGSLYIVLRRAA